MSFFFRLRAGAPAVVAALLLTACGGSTAPPTPPPATSTATATPATSPTATSTATPAPTATRVPTPIPSARVDISTDLSTVYYNVYGTTTDDIFDSIDANGPRLDDGGLGLGLTSWSFPNPDRDLRPATGGCRLVSATLTVEIVVTLPALVEFNSASPEIQQRWEVLADEIAVHEQKHVDIVKAGVGELELQIQSLSSESGCPDLDRSLVQLVDDARARIDVENDAFHAEDDAFLEARRAPLEQQIDANQAELARMESEIKTLDFALDGAGTVIDALGDHLAEVELEIEKIEQDYPGNVLPPDVYARYEALIQEYNSTLARYNDLVDEYNRSLNEAKALTDEYNILVDATNALIEDLIWLQ